MDDRRHAAALSDEMLERDIARALAVDPSPEFVARVRMQIAKEARPTMWRTSWMLSTFAVVAAAVILTIRVNRPDVAVTRDVDPLAARVIAGDISIPIPTVGSGFSRSYAGQPKGGPHARIAGPAEAGRYRSLAPADPVALLDPRETQALRALLAGARTNRVDLSPLLTSTAPATTDLPPPNSLVITPIAIEPLAPIAGAQGERQ